MISDRESLLQLLAYDKWANTEALHSVQSATNVPERAVALIAHIVGTEWVWLERARQSAKPTVVWPKWSPAETAPEIANSANAWRELFDSADLAQVRAYTNSKGEHFENTIADIATHMLLHGTYHRGQIAALLRQSNNQPAYTDYIHYMRTIA